MVKSLSKDEFKVFLGLLRDTRREASLTQGQLGLKLGVDQSLVSDAERGIRRLDIVQIKDWAEACGTSLVRLMVSYESRLESIDEFSEGGAEDGRTNPVSPKRKGEV